MMHQHDTKQMFADALEELVKHEPFERVTVQQIVHACASSRTTFYRHFIDKYDLMNWIYKTGADEIMATYHSLASWRNWILNILLFIRKKGDFFRNILDYKGQNNFGDFLMGYTTTYIMELIQEEHHITKLPKNVRFSLIQYCAGSCYMVENWAREGYIELPEELTRMLMENMPEALKQFV